MCTRSLRQAGAQAGGEQKASELLLACVERLGEMAMGDTDPGVRDVACRILESAGQDA